MSPTEERDIWSGACNASTYARAPQAQGCQARSVTGCERVDPKAKVPFCRSEEALVAEALAASVGRLVEVLFQLPTPLLGLAVGAPAQRV